MTKFLQFCLCCLAVADSTAAPALPPLGLTQVSTTSTLRPNLELIDGTAYLGVSNGVWTVDASGSKGFISLSHPTLGTPSSVTRVVKASDDELYVATSYGSFNNPQGGALYNLEQPLTPIVSWIGNYLVNGVDGQRVLYGNVVEPGVRFEASKFYLDGSVEALPYPPGSDSSNNFTRLDHVTPNSNAIGAAGIPGTIGAAPALWTPVGDFSFILLSGVGTSVRDRLDGQGINIGANDSNPVVRLMANYYYINDMNGDYLNAYEDKVIVSQSDFVVFEARTTAFLLDYYAFYPGIIPGFDNRAVPLLDIFPELAAIDIDQVHDVASVDGYLYMTLSGADGTFLFGARDPSVAVPEPASAILFSIIALAILPRR